ncbi:hypothetical protein [Streptomyces sp. NPDC127100]|uniref:hypothetical protein n=1 Tax=Streptomyces sp. NPDC127100 TaxID=3347138 RepID=UPI003655829F
MTASPSAGTTGLLDSGRTRLRRRLGTWSTLFCLVGAGVVIGTSPASAATLVTCTGTQNISYSPGLTLAPRTVTITGTNNLGPCVAPNTSITSGTIEFSATASSSCLDLLDSGSAVNVVKWSDGSTSTLQVTRTVSQVAGQQVDAFTGSVASGTFQGATVTWTITNVSLDLLDCATPAGLTSQVGLDVFTLASV